MPIHFRVVAGIFGCALLLVAMGEQSQQEDRVLATVNGDRITASQLEAAVRKQIEALDERARQIRRMALNKLIDNLLIEQAARAERISVAEYLVRHVESIEVPGAEVDKAYETSKAEFAGVLPAEAKYRIRRTLEDNRRAAALGALLKGLRQRGRIADDLIASVDFASQEGPALGNAEAPVTVVEFSDFECPYCRAAQPVLKRMLARWPGQIRLVFRHFPLERHPNALTAARAAVCAERQGRFWEAHDRIFAAAGLSETEVRAAILGAGVNAAEFQACMTGGEALDRVRKDVLLGRTVGVAGTPAFFVNRQAIMGAAELEKAVERILGGAR